MISSTSVQHRQRIIRELFDEYIEMYASRDERLTTHFSENFSGYTGSGDFLVKDRLEWEKITRQDFGQVPGRIGIEMLDIAMQDISDNVAVVTAFFHIHLPCFSSLLSKEVARLVLIFRLEREGWKIVHSGISIPYLQRAQAGEVYPLKGLQERNSELEALVEERTQALHESQTLYRRLTEDALDVLWRTDANYCITYISPADERLRGFQADEVIGRHIFEFFNDKGVETVKKVMQQRQISEALGKPVGFLKFEAEHRCKDGSLIWGEVMSKPERNEYGAIVGYHGITREITERKLLEEQVHELAFYDTLTKLANRRLLENRLTQAMSSSKRSSLYGALLFLDLDNFKPLNDAHGHAAGDLLLIEAANRLTSSVRETDTVARFGGDEFVVLLTNLSTNKEETISHAQTIAEKIRVGLSTPYVLQALQNGSAQNQIQHHCTASIGCVVFSGHENSYGNIMDSADLAMYQAKKAGRNSIRFYENSVDKI
ncbi:diguanylate cyclase domain-containing protein [Candidatus Symbiobacter mobilis]|uniref:GGDEF domain protein n=1 Tax=Candidatus Symbiobacter mobilis CR TaxID=946483 RepID=U5N936_9BURK|nr:diguanylate cyclase [Candidatus Symbiobacter mobilis]AGX88071.1 GGDEF domain protein [Candidatus Symbiobacter mobilis CR]